MRRHYSIRRLIHANLYDLWLLLKESWAVLLGFLMVTMLGAIYLRFAYDPCRYDKDPATINCRLSLLESLFETMRMQTLQSGLAFPSDSILGQVLFFSIPLLGLALIFQGVLNFGRLLLDKSSRREAWQIALANTYRNHVIVCGLGRVGMRTVEQLLEAGHEPVAIERDWSSEFVEHIINHKVPVVLGDAREPLSLQRAGLAHARTVVAGINNDLLNLEIALTVRQIHPQTRIILRIFNDELDLNLERSIGRHTAFSASALAAPTYAAAAVNRHVDVVIQAGGARLALSQILVRADSPFRQQLATLEETNKLRVLEHALVSNGTATVTNRQLPRGTAPESARADLRNRTLGSMGTGMALSPGPHSSDRRITLLGTLAALEMAHQANDRASMENVEYQLPQHPDEHYSTVIVCGLGKVGYRVVRQLYRINPRPRIVIICLGDQQNEFPQRIRQLEGVQIITGDARDSDILRMAGIMHAFSVAALTSNDLLNLQIGLSARRLRPDTHIVLRVFSETLASKLSDMFGIHTAYSTSALASPTLAAAALLGNVSQGFLVNGQLHATDRIRIASGSALLGCSLAELRNRHELLALDLRRAGVSTLLPALDITLLDGDEVTLLAPMRALKRLRRLKPV